LLIIRFDAKSCFVVQLRRIERSQTYAQGPDVALKVASGCLKNRRKNRAGRWAAPRARQSVTLFAKPSVP